MKKSKLTNKTATIALVAGTAGLMSLNSQVHAQSSVDALLNKLEQKGILSVDEAKELKAENATNSVEDFNKALNSHFPIPDWITGYKLSGDFRGRFDDITVGNGNSADRLRFRYRLRAGLTVTMKDGLEAGFRLGSSDPAPSGSYGGNPLSNNSTLQDNGTKKFVYIDTAYGKWTAINDGTWLLSTTVGKMDNPFQFTPMVFDPDLTPEGWALQANYNINAKHSIVFNGAAFVLDEESKSSLDPALFGAQIAWNAKWSPKVATSIGVGAFDIVNHESLTTNNVPYVNQGNFRNGTAGSNGALLENFKPVIADASVTYMFDSFPLYHGAFPVKLAGEYMNNQGASFQNEGFWGGITFGKAGKKGLWDLSYRYEYLEANAWYDQLVDDDNIGFYQAAPAAGASGVFGGTNVKGHLVKLNYSITDALTFTFSCYINSLIHPMPGTSDSDAMHVMADLMWKF